MGFPISLKYRYIESAHWKYFQHEVKYFKKMSTSRYKILTIYFNFSIFLSDDNSSLVQVMTWLQMHQAITETNDYPLPDT